MKAKAVLLASFLLLFGVGCMQKQERPDNVKTATILSSVFTVDKLYKSMLGPYRTGELMPVTRAPELIWITGFESVVVTPDGEQQLSQEFMCHSNLRYNNLGAPGAFNATRHKHGRIFTISQGQTAVEFPPGFGIPIMGNETLLLDNQMLNVNIDPKTRPEPLSLRYKNTISYIKDEEAERQMAPLYQVEAGVMVSLDTTKSYFSTLNPDDVQSGAFCAPGVTATEDLNVVRSDEFGQDFSYHWILKPGKEVRRTLITDMLDLQFDTRIHYISVHMHPYARSLVLRDMTDDKVLYESRMESYEDKIGLKKVEHFASVEGIPIYKDHDYELISTYNNTSGQDQDAMALVYIYLHDKRFEM